MIFFRVFSRESMDIKSLFLTPVLPEAKARGMGVKMLPHHTHPAVRRPLWGSLDPGHLWREW